MNKIALSLAANYVSSWGTWEAVRELLQNALDCENQDITFDRDNNKIKITSYGGTIPVKHLLLGSGTKSDDEDSIGGFSEGMKLAFLVLARQGYFIDICNGRDKWYPNIEFSQQFGEECLHIGIKANVLPETFADKVTMTLEGFTNEEMIDIQGKYIPKELDDELAVFGDRNTGYGFNPSTTEDINEFWTRQEVEDYEYTYDGCEQDFTPRLFVSGLYICDLPKDTRQDNYFRYSYNFPPNKLQLDRDRRAVDDFEIRYEVSKLLVQLGETDILSDLAKDHYQDVSGYCKWHGAHYGSGSKTRDAELTFDEDLGDKAWQGFMSKYGDYAVPINATWSADKKESMQIHYRKAGKHGVEVSSSYFEMLESYVPEIKAVKSLKKFDALDFLTAFADRNRKHMRSKPMRELKEAIQYITETKGLF